ncbi:MAG: hypothetical protein R3C52_04455 [Hyphomonadaceae bacterium]
MKRALFALSLLPAFMLGACGEKPEPAAPEPESEPIISLGTVVDAEDHSTMGAYARQVSAIADAMDSAHDRESAQAAAAEIDRIAKEMEPLAEKLKGLSDEERAAAALASMQPLMQAQTRIAMTTSRLAAQDPESLRMLTEELKKLPEY